jgi:hypothetical protein
MAYTDNDFGFTAVDETELNILLPQSQPVATPPAVSSDAVSAIQAKLVEMDAKLAALKPTVTAVSRVEEKIDRVLNMELGELNSSIKSQGDNLSVVLSEVEDRTAAMRDECKSKLLEVEGLILPLLNNLMANPQKDYIHWANRTERLSTQIDRITRVTRSYGV